MAVAFPWGMWDVYRLFVTLQFLDYLTTLLSLLLGAHEVNPLVATLTGPPFAWRFLVAKVATSVGMALFLALVSRLYPRQRGLILAAAWVYCLETLAVVAVNGWMVWRLL